MRTSRDQARGSGGAIALTAAIGVVLAFATASIQLAFARGGDNPSLPMTISPQPSFATPSAGPGDSSEPKATKRVAAPVSTGAFCVRLCDGFYFPAISPRGGDAACAVQCPDAPTALYTKRPGSDRIEDAVSMLGAKYSDLASAGRHLDSVDNTCTCRRARSDGAMPRVMEDSTLRKGDIVMTTNGLVVYEGSKGGDAKPTDFVPLAKAPNVSKETRESLTAMERAGPAERQSGAHSGDLAPPAPPALKHKGVITIDDTPAEVGAK